MKNRVQSTRNSGKRHGLIGRAATAVRRLFGRSHDEQELVAIETPARTSDARPMARPVRREADIPLDILEHTYTPAATSSKASFRSDGSDHELDQEFAGGFADDRWKDEDHFTNKSGDPRIGTHGRSSDDGREQRR